VLNLESLEVHLELRCRLRVEKPDDVQVKDGVTHGRRC